MTAAAALLPPSGLVTELDRELAAHPEFGDGYAIERRSIGRLRAGLLRLAQRLPAAAPAVLEIVHDDHALLAVLADPVLRNAVEHDLARLAAGQADRATALAAFLPTVDLSAYGPCQRLAEPARSAWPAYGGAWVWTAIEESTGPVAGRLWRMLREAFPGIAPVRPLDPDLIALRRGAALLADALPGVGGTALHHVRMVVLARQDEAEPDRAHHGPAHHGPAHHGPAHHGRANDGRAERGGANDGRAERGGANDGRAERGGAERGSAERRGPLCAMSGDDGLPGALLIAPARLRSPRSTARLLLREGARLALFEIDRCQPLLAAGPGADTPAVPAPWCAEAWSAGQALAALHGYAHLALFRAAIQAAVQAATRAGRADTALARAGYLADQLERRHAHRLTPHGLALVRWLAGAVTQLLR